VQDPAATTSPRPGGASALAAPAGGHPPVVVFGECLIDRFAEGDVAGGAPFNVARHLGAFGLDPFFITRIGADPEGAQLRAALAAFGVRDEGVQVDPERATGLVRVHGGTGGHVFEILPDRAYDAIAPTALPAALATPAHGPAWLYFGTLAQRSAASRAALDALRARLPHRAFVDLNWRDGQVPPAIALAALDAADTLKVSGEELGLILSWRGLSSTHAGLPPAPGTACAGVAALLAGSRVRRLIVTHGALGYALWDADGRCALSGPSAAVPTLVDTVGAGDAFSAVVLTGLLLDWPMPATLLRANAFAAAICGVRGAAPTQAGFHARWMQAWQAGA